MPDIISVIGNRGKLMLFTTLTATLVAVIACLLSPKEYVGVTTALPVNTLVNDKARIFNQNIEALYSEIGSADELDKVEGTSKLDTLFLAVANDHHLAAHYEIDMAANDALDKAALKLKKNSAINRTGYGELKIKVWDKDNNMAASLANALMQKINEIHQRLQTENSRMILQQLKEEYKQKTQEFDSIANERLSVTNMHDSMAVKTSMENFKKNEPTPSKNLVTESLKEALLEYPKLINEYELAVKTTPKVLLIVEHARPSPWIDKPKTGQIILLTFLASLLFSFFVALFVESRNAKS